MRAGYVPNSNPAGIVYTADVFDKAALDLIVQHNIPCQHRFAGHDQSTG